MAAADVAQRPQERTTKRRPFAAWVKRLTNLKGGEQNSSNSKDKKSGNPLKGKKGSDNVKNNPYPESGYVHRQSPRSSRDGQLSFATPQHQHNDDGSSVISGHVQEDKNHPSNRSAAPTVATIPGTIQSDTGHSRAFTNTTAGGGLSMMDGAGNGSTFSSPNHSERSLTTTLTTIQSTSPANTLQQPGASGNHAQHSGQPAIMFSHQYPVSPAPSTLNAPSAIPRHLATEANQSSLLTDDASIVTLASSSKRRRRSMDTDASVRALAPASVWGGSRESLPLSVLSGNAEATDRASTTGLYSASVSRPSVGGFASTERASVYSSHGVNSPSERNSYYAGPGAAGRKDLSDAKSLRSITGLDARSQYDARSINDAKSTDARSLRNYEGSIRSGALGHGCNDSIPGSIGSPLASPGVRHPSASGAVSRRSSDWQGEDETEKKEAAPRPEGETNKP
ncbi:hypothetical protein Q7P37_009021 [Cladosporium fusiforme]